MRWFGRILATALARRIAFVIVAALLALAGIGRSYAATSDTQETALGQCQAEAQWRGSQPNPYWPRYVCHPFQSGQPTGYWTVSGYGDTSLENGAVTYSCANCRQSYGQYTWGTACAAPSVWSTTANKCDLVCPDGFTQDPFSPGQCLTAQKCQARNADINTEAFRSGGDVCAPVGGCAFEASTSDISNTAINGGGSLVRARYSYTGRPASVCSAAPQGTPEEQDQNKPSDTKQACRQLSDQTVCVKPDGQHCYSINGKPNMQHCWQPGETGQKTQEDTAQKRDAGPSEIPPNLNLPNGDTLQKVGQSVTTTTSKTVNNVTTVTTTTTTNYKTANGTNAGTKNQAEPGDGTGQPGDDSTTASGGEDCKTKPIVSDPALQMVATQAWATRCAIRAGNAVKVTGDLANCQQPFTVEGDTAGMTEGENRQGIEQLKALRKSYCGDQDTDSFDAVGTGQAAADAAADSTGNGDAAYTDGSKASGGFGDGEGPDDTGVGFSRTCPNLPSVDVLGQTVDFDAIAGGKLCDWITLGGYFVMLIAAIASARILTTGAS